MRVLLLSRYGSKGASSRVRYLQYLQYFKSQGFSIDVDPFFSNDYLEALYGAHWRVGQVLTGYARRLRTLIRSWQYDLLVIEKEVFPFLPAGVERLLEGLGIPYVVDYDDAMFHRYDLHSNVFVRRLLGRKIDTVMRHASVVIAGNPYLADRAKVAKAKRIEIIPTVVDTERYQPVLNRGDRVPVVGWIGTPKTSRYLDPLIPVFDALRREMAVRFVAVGARPEEFAGTSIETWPWSENSEVSSIQSFDIGIMPLPDTPWERGKCGYKLIQYMACGLPVVASPVGVNADIILDGRSGFLAEGGSEWKSALSGLLADNERRLLMGREGRARVVAWYSLAVQSPRLLAALKIASRSCVA